MRRQTIIVLCLGAGLLLLFGIIFIGCSGPPQMGADEETFTAVDALFTAVTARDEKLLHQCEQRLHALRQSGKLPARAGDYLDRIIQTAHAGSWQAAAERLYNFMKGQRREGRR